MTNKMQASPLRGLTATCACAALLLLVSGSLVPAHAQGQRQGGARQGQGQGGHRVPFQVGHVTKQKDQPRGGHGQH